MENNNQQNSENLENQFDPNSIDEFLENEGGEDDGDVINKKELRKRNKRYINYSIIVGVLIVVFSIGLALLFSYSKYYALNGKEDELTPSEENFISKMDTYNNYIKKGKNYIYSLVGVSTSVNNVSNVQQANLENIDNYLDNNSISFVDKRSALKNEIESKLNTIQSNKEKINELRSNIGKYGFLPQEVDNILLNNSLQRSIVSIESIKFFTALKIFNYLDSFVNSFSDYIGNNSSAIKEQMKFYSNRGESDTYRYLQKCYLNPYETERCNRFNDFDRFYAENGIRGKFNPRLFKDLLGFINQKLESSNFPKLIITLNNLDPQSNSISFTININTFKEDQVALLNLESKNILNPHIFIASTLIDLLRESHFIIAKSININTLEVSKNKVKIGDEEYVVNNSSFSFTVPVQSSTEREIYDYVYDN